MRRLLEPKSGKDLIAGGLACALLILTAIGLLVAAPPGQAAGPAPATAPAPTGSERLAATAPVTDTSAGSVGLPAWVQALLEQEDVSTGSDDLGLVKTAETGVGAGDLVYNGEAITYTLTLSNPTATAASDILILDILPQESLSDIHCSDNCERVVEVQQIPDPFGNLIAVTITRQVSWTLDSLAPGQAKTLQFWGTVTGQADGTELRNRAFFNYQHGGLPKAGLSNDARTLVRVRINENGAASLSNAANWLSQDFGGTLSMDWGDFDQDGYLDLALGSTIGTSVYRNDAGRLTLFWSNDRLTYGVAWGDFDDDGYLDLAAVGESLDGTPVTSGTNYIYSLEGSSFAEYEFTSNEQLVRVAPGDYDGDGFLDLVVSTNSINAPCPVKFYRNTQNGAAPFGGQPACVSSEATAAIGPVDYDNDGDLDLALGLFPNQTFLFVNSSPPGDPNPFAAAAPLAIDQFAPFLPYDLSWGDYNGDGYLDLAAAFPLERRVRIYRNEAGSALTFDAEIRTDLFRTPLAVEWGDMNGDGRLDLAVADSPPRVYEYRSGVFSPILSLPLDAVGGQVWELGIVDQDNEGDLDLAVSNRDGPSMLFSNFAPLLSPGLSQITGTGSTAAASVAWGDAEGDGDLDLLFGASQTTVGARLYHNVQGTFPAADIVPYLASGFGPHTVAFGDVDGDTRLDVALGLGTTAGLQVYLAGHTDAPDWTSAAPHYPNHNIAWGDADDDGDLDLLAGRDGPNALYVNRDGQLESVPRWTSATIYDSRSIAWGDYNGDRYLDFAVGNDGQPNELYRNNRDNTFSRVWIAPDLFNTRSVAWGDYDGDGDLDLAVGNYGQANLIYENAGGSLGTTPAWQSAFVRHTTSLAWGDWDNDGDLDLAVGNDGEPDQVYANLNSQPGATPQLYWLWASSEAQRTSGLAWGDGDGDGDLDLAVSHRSGGPNGIYQNNYVRPSHLSDDFVQTMPLPNNPTYLAVARPGQTDGAYGYSSAELLSGPKNPTVTVPYKLFDPDGTRQDTPPTNLPGDRVLSTTYEFSLDGGASWQAATPLGTENPTTTTLRLGQSATFLWDAVADAAISDNARFRISTIQQNGTDPAQRGTIRAISPPFRVRGTTCVWPRDPAIEVSIPTPEPGQTVRLAGTVAEASGILTYTWDFGDGSSDRGQVVYHTFYNNGTYPVKLTVRSEPCPLAKEVSVTRLLVVGSGIPSIYLPFVAKASTSRAPAPPAPPEAATDVRGSGNSQTPAGDAGLAGASRVAAGTERVRPAAGIGFSRARSGFGMLPITQGTKGINSQPSVSADGQQIAFWSTDDLTRSGSNADGNPEIFIADVGSNGAVTFIQMTQSAGNILGGFNLSPSLSDDGTRVALFSDRDLTGQGINLDSNFEIFWAAVGSPAPEQLTRTDVGANTLPSLSGDGNRVAFASDRNLAADNGDYNQEIFVYDAALDDFIQVTNTPRTVLNDQPAANVDGSRIAFTSNGELFVAGVTADGNVTLTPLPNPTGQSNRQPAISADGKTITFLSGGDVFVTEIGPGGSMTTTQITDSPGAFIDEPAISADGTRVAFVSDGGIFFFDKEADLLSQISDVTNAQHPSLSADGTILAYVSNREIWITNAPRTDLAANKTSEPQPLVPGRPLTYTIVITNFGPTDAISATVIDAIPAAVKRPVWTCTAAGGSTCQDGSGNLISDTVHVLVGTTITYVITGSAAPWLKGDLVNTVVVSTPPGIVDWRPSNNLSTDVGSSLPEADLGLAKTVDVPIPNEGEPVHFVLVATNGGPSDAQSTLVTDTLPAGLTYAGSAATLGSYSGDIWTLGTLPAETSATLTLTATVDVGSGGMVITNTARGPRAIGTDPNPGNNNASATLTVNAPPRARDDLATTREDQPVPVDVLANDDDPEGALDPTTLVTVTQPASGTLLLNPPSGIITYTPYLNFHGTDGFLYRICDTSGSCATAAVTLTVTAINDPPVASNDTYAVDEDDLLVVVAPGVLGNDVEPDGTPLTATLSGGVSHGSLRFQADGSFAYTPTANYFGPDGFTYVASDGLLTDTASVSITVNSINDPPLAGGDAATVGEGGTVTVLDSGQASLLFNDSDPEGGNLTLDTTPPVLPDHGAVTLQADGTFTYTHDGSETLGDSFIYRVCDDGTPSACATASVTITVNPANDPPLAVGETATVDEGGTVAVLDSGQASLLFNDSDPEGGNLTLATTPPAPPNHGTVALRADGTFTYTHDGSETLGDLFAYRVCDDGTPSACATANVTITVNPIDEPPVALDDSATTVQSGTVSVLDSGAASVLANDYDPEGAAIEAKQNPVVAPSHGTLTLNKDGTFTYTHDGSATSSDSFVYTVCDAPPPLCTNATVTITINSSGARLDDPPPGLAEITYPLIASLLPSALQPTSYAGEGSRQRSVLRASRGHPGADLPHRHTWWLSLAGRQGRR